MTENRHEFAQPDAEAVPFESTPVQDNDQDIAQDDAESRAHPDTLAGEVTAGDVDFNPDEFDEEPDEDDER